MPSPKAESRKGNFWTQLPELRAVNPFTCERATRTTPLSTNSTSPDLVTSIKKYYLQRCATKFSFPIGKEYARLVTAPSNNSSSSIKNIVGRRNFSNVAQRWQLWYVTIIFSQFMLPYNEELPQLAAKIPAHTSHNCSFLRQPASPPENISDVEHQCQLPPILDLSYTLGLYNGTPLEATTGTSSLWIAPEMVCQKTKKTKNKKQNGSSSSPIALLQKEQQLNTTY